MIALILESHDEQTELLR
jgi:hypothetical protein